MTPRSVNTSIHWLCPIRHVWAHTSVQWVRVHSLSLSLSLRLVSFDSLPLSLSLSLSFHPLCCNSYSAHRAQGSQTEMQRHARKWEWVSVCAFTLIYFTEAWETVTHAYTHRNVSASQWDSSRYLHNVLCHLLSMPWAQHLLKESSVKESVCVCECVLLNN